MDGRRCKPVGTEAVETLVTRAEGWQHPPRPSIVDTSPKAGTRRKRGQA
nr:MAG TPA: hypothetical protein [Caudoviricetes sp.]